VSSFGAPLLLVSCSFRVLYGGQVRAIASGQWSNVCRLGANDLMKISTKAQCPECLRVFDLLDDTDSQEWAYGHDCE
jgi:hypothetical protein